MIEKQLLRLVSEKLNVALIFLNLLADVGGASVNRESVRTSLKMIITFEIYHRVEDSVETCAKITTN